MDLEHEQRLTAAESRSKSNAHRLDEVEKRQNNLEELVATVKVIAFRQENVESVVKGINNKVEELTNKPGRRWDALVDKAIWAIAAAVITFLLAKIGL